MEDLTEYLEEQRAKNPDYDEMKDPVVIEFLKKRREQEEKDFIITPPNKKLREALKRIDKEFGYKQPEIK